jgi:hypothetical protein
VPRARAVAQTPTVTRPARQCGGGYDTGEHRE